MRPERWIRYEDGTGWSFMEPGQSYRRGFVLKESWAGMWLWSNYDQSGIAGSFRDAKAKVEALEVSP